MLNLFGWAGAAGAGDALLAARQYLTQACGVPARAPPTAAVSASGAGWACIGPAVQAADGVAVAFRGQPVWRTTEPRIVNAPDPASAVREAYRLHGMRFLELLHGGFAVAIFDTEKRTVVLAVDRVGIERLTYATDADSLWFATSAEVIARRPGASVTLRRQALLSYLFFHMIPSPETAFEGVRKIPPATVLVWKDGRLTEETYWRPAFVPAGSGDFASLKDNLHAALATGVNAAHPDADTGAFLSGGLDSSTVAGVFARQTPAPPARTFSIGFGFPEYDELSYARIANARFGCKATEYEVRPDDIVELIPVIARAYDEPFGNASAVPTYCCARLALNHGVTHLLAGDGGDEIFAGNKRYAEQLVFERYGHIPGVFRKGLLEPALRLTLAALGGKLVRKGRSYVAQANVPLPDRLENWNFLYRLGFDTVLDPDFAAAVDRDAPAKHMRAVFGSAPPGGLVDRMLYYDWRFTLADNDLRKVGSMCDLAGVRVSYPMLHPDVIDMSIRVPPDMKMRGTQLRSFYKEAMADFLPNEIINKSKHGFGLPFGLWLERSPALAALIDGNLASLRERRVVRPEFIDKLRHLHGQEDAAYYGGFLWTLAMLEQWFREHGLAP